jgi:hypothetical protein
MLRYFAAACAVLSAQALPPPKATNQAGILGNHPETVGFRAVDRPHDVGDIISIGIVQLDVGEALSLGAGELVIQILDPARPCRVDLSLAVFFRGVRARKIGTVVAGFLLCVVLLVEQIAILDANSVLRRRLRVEAELGDLVLFALRGIVSTDQVPQLLAVQGHQCPPNDRARKSGAAQRNSRKDWIQPAETLPEWEQRCSGI